MMMAIFIVTSVFVWLGMGGWAFAVIAKDANQNQIGSALCFCLFLAPFAAGMSLKLNFDRRGKACTELNEENDRTAEITAEELIEAAGLNK